MGYNDEFYDDDDYFDDDEDLDDDEEIGFDRSSVNPFRTGGSSGTGSLGSSSSGLPGRSRFGGSGGSLTSRLSSASDDDGKRDTGEFDSERERLFGKRSSSGEGDAASRFGGRPIGSRRADDNDDGTSRVKSPVPGNSSDSRLGGASKSGSSGNRFGGSGSSRIGGGSSKDDKKDNSKARTSSFGGSSSGGGSRFGGGSSKDDKKDNSKARTSSFGGSSSGGGNRFGGSSGGGSSTNRFGGSKDGKNEDSKGKNKAADGGSGGRFGGLGNRFGSSKKDDKNNQKQSTTSKDKSNKDGGGIAGVAGGLAAGIGNRFGGGNTPQKDNKNRDKKSAASGQGGRFSGLGSRFGGGNTPQKDNKNRDKKSAASGRINRNTKQGKGDSRDSGKQSAFGRDKGGKQSTSKKESKSASTVSGGILAGLTTRLPFGGGKKHKKPQRTSKTRASKIPTTKQDSGLSLDDKLDILGVGFIIAAFILFLSSLSGEQGVLTGAVNGIFIYLLGWGAVAVPIILLAVGFWLIVRHFGEEPPEIDLVRVTGLAVLYLTGLVAAMFYETFSPLYAGVTTVDQLVLFLSHSIEQGKGGGLIGAELYTLLVSNVTEVGAVVSMIGLGVIGIMLATRTTAGELAIFVISLWRSLQVSVQQRAQKQRALRLEAQQRAAEEAARISVSRPAPAELGAGATNALPEPALQDRAIPIRMGGQMVTANLEEPGQPVLQPQPVMQGAIQRSPQPATEPKSRGFVGDFAVRLLGSVPGRRNKQTQTPVQPHLQPTPQVQPTAQQPAPEAQATSFSTLLGQSHTQPSPISSEIPQNVPAHVDAAQNRDHIVERPAIVPAKAAAQAPLAVQSNGEKSPLPGQAQKPAASFTVPGRIQEDTPVDQPRPALNQDRHSGRGGKGGTGRAASPIPPSKDGTPPLDETLPAPPDDNKLTNRLNRLDAIRKGDTSRPAADLRGSLLDEDKDKDETQLAEPINGTPKTSPVEPSATTSPQDLLTAAPTEKSSNGPQRPTPFTPPGTSNGADVKPFSAPDDRKSFSLPTSRAATPRKVEATPSSEESRPEPRINTPRAVQPAKAALTESQKPSTNWKLPDVRTLLSSGSEQDFDRDSLVRQARIIEETLQSFGAPGRVVEINTGPVITQYGVEPDYLNGRNGKKSRVKVSAIAQLDKDLQLALGAKSIRVEAPVPGKGYVGIEVPNEKASLVSLRDVMESDSFSRYESPLAIGLGQSVDGAPIAADLRQMPHLLIAGTTGSGKSVCVNAIIGSILARNTPNIVKFIMVDPKRVELTGYNGIPHLVAPVVVELERIVGVLKWVTREMDERYKKFSGAGARNIEDYNQHIDASVERMPYIIVIIDELADLMMLAPDETERVITRIAALARATGIHLVIATQRPSVDVVTGLIKANFPARIAFAVAGSVDSRVILDQPGAERLLGRGDMLFMSGDSPAPQRLQGVYVSDMEINNMTRFWKSQNIGQTQQKPITALVADEDMPQSRSVIPRGERFMQPPPPSTRPQSQSTLWDDEEDDDLLSKGIDHEDELYEEAVEMVRRLNKASVSLLQRRLRIGYTRAARLIDTMESEGIIGPPVEGSKPRKVLPPKIS